jgi:GR25 family glycosyltransferase involved in LPS biosynthesis
MKKWDTYVISLDRTPERMRFMEAEFKDTVLTLHKFSAHDDPQKRGWVGCGKSWGNVVKKHMETDPDFTKKLCIVLEDDAYRIQDKKTFNERCTQILEYLENHRGEYSHFQGGGIYPSVDKLECEDPLLIRCDWITCATFTVIGKEAADTILKYQDVPDEKKEPIDNYLAANNRKKMLVPYPHLVWQLFGTPSTISSEDQKTTLNEGFRDAHKILTEFLAKENIQLTMKNLHLNTVGGVKKRSKRSKTLSFVNSVLRKRSSLIKKFHLKNTRNVVSSSRTRKSSHSSKAE